MLLCKVIVTFLYFVWSSKAQELYHIPEPKIEVFSPEHFRISIEDNAGVTFVAFHVNINQDLHRQQIGEFSKEVFHSIHGRWTFEVSKAHLNNGDILNYWIFVIQDHMGYSKLGQHTLAKLRNGTFEITKIPSMEPPPKQSVVKPEKCKTCAAVDEMQIISLTTSSPAPQQIEQISTTNYCELFLLNTTQNLLTLQSQLETARKENQQLTNLLEYYPDAKKLTLKTSKIPSNNDPVLTVKFIIREKLNINPDIVSAVKISENSIEFKVATVSEKLEILEAAKIHLVNSRFSIS